MPDFPFKNYALAVALTSFLVILVALLAKRWLPPQIPLFYGLPEGEEQLASTWKLVIPGAIAFIIAGVNILLSFFLKDDFLKKTLIVASFTATFFAAITTLKIIFLVGIF